ncbi:flagellar motor protein MotB [Chromohalobacter canadensis]|uniref:Chemotaxis protein MotB n=1 Tax=Chromohalobacter canadensis TaxID=141389 RepID=A0A285VVL6_9GAMM|nr:flagellar motor protein MotB [Chromohalobacter canadensis]MCK0768779.1 flagellar motor protein MotB [Chromohalobacter canadensis]WQH09278.1 flagellar motor protein MotB [Chromohalobacter canadensis]SOC58062.1 chemotaxis protein MotB [Chromohalobacter canadensis]
MSNERRPIIVKRKKVVSGAPHGGNWKIAYADFMTALMALFLVLWILSMVPKNELSHIAEYFRTPLAVAMTGGDKSTASTSAIPGGGADPTFSEGEERRLDVRQQSRPSDEMRRLRVLRDRLERQVREDPNLRQMSSQLRTDFIPEGLRIQLVDTDKRPMFELGSARLAPYMRDLLQALAPELNAVPNAISLTGHTDDLRYAGGEAGYSNWELSADRANASRRTLVAAGLDSGKLLRVAGMGSRVNLEGTKPSDAVNRRISIVVLSEYAAEQIRDQGEAGASSPEGILDSTDDTQREGLSPTQGADSLMRNALPQVYERTTGGGEGQDQPSP